MRDATIFGGNISQTSPALCGGIDNDRENASDNAAQLIFSRPPLHDEIRASGDDTDGNLIGTSKSFREVMTLVKKVAATNLPVLLTGEFGTGKEVIAAALHRQSGRANKPFTTVNCGAIPDELIESELFGHVRGSFAGAERDMRGLLENSAGGTVFLDEITETSKSFQLKLLRVLQLGEIRPVGSNATKRVDVRVIAASNPNIQAQINTGRFREDLFYRLSVVSIMLPPLRERRDDILSLARTFASRAGKSRADFSPEALDLLARYPWPGNIRELENAMLRAATVSRGIICEHDLPHQVRTYASNPDQEKTRFENDFLPLALSQEWPCLREIETRYIQLMLRHTAGNKQAASRLLGVDRKTLDRKIKRQQINPRGAPFRLRAS